MRSISPGRAAGSAVFSRSARRFLRPAADSSWFDSSCRLATSATISAAVAGTPPPSACAGTTTDCVVGGGVGGGGTCTFACITLRLLLLRYQYPEDYVDEDAGKGDGEYGHDHVDDSRQRHVHSKITRQTRHHAGDHSIA